MKNRLRIIIEKISSKAGFFSTKQIAKEILISPKDVQIVLDRLFREGMVQRFDLIPNPGEAAPLRGRPKKRTIYQVASKTKLKERFRSKVKQDTAADRMWKIIRAKRDFTVRDLVVLAGAKKENARWFLKKLYRARYISPSGLRGEWSLIKLRDPGPQRPYLGKA
jgi:predicted ArsR family transcriptional regulator